MSGVTPCLWFDGNAEEAAKFYASLFPNSHIDAVHRAPSDYPSGKAGGVLMVEFRLMGQPFTGLNGGPQFQFYKSISFQIPVETQAEADRFADALSAVPEAEQCGWVKDRFGVANRSPPAYQADRRCRSRPGKAGVRRDDANEAHRHRRPRARRRRHRPIPLNRQLQGSLGPMTGRGHHASKREPWRATHLGQEHTSSLAKPDGPNAPGRAFPYRTVVCGLVGLQRSL